MIDIFFFRDSNIFTLYNRYQGAPASAENLCKGPTDTKYLRENAIFTEMPSGTTAPGNGDITI